VAYQVFETTVFNRVLQAEAQMLFVPREVVAELPADAVILDHGADTIAPYRQVLGVEVGVRIPDADGLVDVLFASAAGRTYSFDEGSFRRWRRQWSGQPTEQSAFAQEMVFGECTPVSESPLRAETMAALLERGEAYVANGATWMYAHPFQGLGVVVLVDGAILVASLRRAVRETVVIAAKYHLRRMLGVPADWLPPEDR
jgi:hypothetical protein